MIIPHTQQPYLVKRSCLACGLPCSADSQATLLTQRLAQSIWALRLLRRNLNKACYQGFPHKKELTKKKEQPEHTLQQGFSSLLFDVNLEECQMACPLQKSFQSTNLESYDSQTEDYFNEIWNKLNPEEKQP